MPFCSTHLRSRLSSVQRGSVNRCYSSRKSGVAPKNALLCSIQSVLQMNAHTRDGSNNKFESNLSGRKTFALARAVALSFVCVVNDYGITHDQIRRFIIQARQRFPHDDVERTLDVHVFHCTRLEKGQTSLRCAPLLRSSCRHFARLVSDVDLVTKYNKRKRVRVARCSGYKKLVTPRTECI